MEKKVKKKERKNWCFWIVMLEKTLESPLDSQEFQPVHSKGNKSWIFIRRTDVEAETPILWPLDERTDSFEKILDAVKVGGEGDDRGWDGWMASMNQWTWVWVNSESRWWKRKHGFWLCMGSQRVRHDWETELNRTEALNSGKLFWDIPSIIFPLSFPLDHWGMTKLNPFWLYSGSEK